MLYFSELNHIPVLNSQGKKIGRLEDLIFSFDGTPHIRKILIGRKNKNFLQTANIFRSREKNIISLDFVEKLDNTKVTLKEHYEKIEIGENELYVKKNILDTQVIDVEENNIVRVNDVLIQNVNSHGFVIYGVDIGFSGILRWLKIDKFINKGLRVVGKHYIPESFLAWSDIQPLELTRGRVAVKSRFDKFKKLHPADVADYLEDQNLQNVLALIEGMDKKYLAKVISELNPSFQMNILRLMPLEKVGIMIPYMDPDDAVDMLSQFSPRKQEIILNLISVEEASEIRRLFNFGITSLGKFLNPDFLTVHSEETVSSVVKKIKNLTQEFSSLPYVYVANKQNQLIGVIDLHELIMQSLDKPIYIFMNQRVIAANLNTPTEVAFRRMIKYKIECLPIVDDKRKILGIVSVDDLGDDLLKKISG
ncbi:magnesium transporter [Candidatus Parcubacteria bacterium]|nr:MAG: magnesium transporter [Candidatus Parcubacteria bacterium]